MPGTAAISSTGASRTRFAEPNTRSSARRRVGPTPGQVVERGAHRRLGAQLAVVGDREPVRLVAQPLDEVERLRRRGQHDRVASDPAGTAPRVPWPGRRAGRSCEAELVEHLDRRAHLALAAVDDARGPAAASAAPRRSPPRPSGARRNRRRSTSWWLAKSSGPPNVAHPEPAVLAASAAGRPRTRPCCRPSTCPGWC